MIFQYGVKCFTLVKSSKNTGRTTKTERDRERKKGTERETNERDRQRHKWTERKKSKRNRQIETERDRERQKEIERDRMRPKQTLRDKNGQKETKLPDMCCFPDKSIKVGVTKAIDYFGH